MTDGFKTVLSASEKDRRDLFVSTGGRIGSVEQNIEKDFWVCWTLDALFNGLQPGGPRLLFKGGTSLSKGFGLIARFSEDIDITVFREDIGEPATVEELESISGKKRAARLDAIRAACQGFINGALRQQIEVLLRGALEDSNLAPESGRVEPDPDDPDQQSLLLWYPTVTVEGAGYIRRAVKIESGAKSALDPHSRLTVKPYVADELKAVPFDIPNATIVEAGRTFWDKVVILHGLRRWWERRGELRGGGQRVSRHYYDVSRMLASPKGDGFAANLSMAADCVRHARMFFNRPDLDLATAMPGTFALMPHDDMLANLRTDYAAMAGMIFGEIPKFDEIATSISTFETRINSIRKNKV
jgi:hypothetical protein